MRAVVFALVMLAGAAADARAQGEQIDGVGSLMLHVDYTRAEEPDAAPDLTNALAAGLRGRIGFGEDNCVYGGVDFTFGAGLAGGFIYDANLYILGYARRFGRGGFAALAAGVGLSGATDRIPFDGQFVIEASLEADLGRRLRLAAWVRPSGVIDEDSRRDGTPDSPVGDELTAAVGLRWGRSDDWTSATASKGWFAGFTWREQLDQRFLGVTLAWSATLATERPRR